MRTLIATTAATLVLLTAGPAFAGPKVELDTSHGKIVIELDDKKAPLSTKNYLEYVNAGQYNGTIFHRVIKNFMLQGGGFTKDLVKKPTKPAIQNESKNGVLNTRGTVAMARLGSPHSATSQFFINTVDNGFLDAGPKKEWGYAVFAKVINGMDTVDKIRNLPTGACGPFSKDCPKTQVVIKTAKVVK